MTLRRGAVVAVVVCVLAGACAPGVRLATGPARTYAADVRLEILFTAGSASGRVACALFDGEAGFDASSAPVAATTLDLVDGRAEWSVEVPAGAYAVKAYLDADGDGTLDRNALGIPTEPYGISNGARGRFGPPSWSDAAFSADRPVVTLEIELR